MNTKEKYKKLFNFRPVLFLAFDVAMGILLGYFFYYNKYLLFFSLLSIYILFKAYFVFLYKSELLKTVRCIFVLVGVVFCLLLFFYFVKTVDNYNEANLNNMYLSVKAKVKDCIDNDDDLDSQKLVLKDISVSGAINGKLKYNMNLYVSDGDFEIGDIISFSAYIFDYKDIYNGSFSGTMIEERIKYYASIDKNGIVIVDKNLSVFEKVNLFIKNTLKSGMDYDEFSVAYSMLVGKSEVIDDNILSSFRNTGVAHIFAVSGLHIGFLLVAVSFLFSALKVNKYLASFLTFIIVLFYSGVCGFTPSSVRAVIMATTLMASRLSGKKYDVLSSISFAFILILIVSPLQLFCLGFKLSFCAVLGIVLFSRKIEKIFKFLPKKIASSLSTSISATLLTLPLLMKYFGKVSTISVFINVLFIPLVSVVFVMLVVCLLIGGIFSIERIALFVPSKIIFLMRNAISFFDKEIFLISFLLFTIPLVFYYLTTFFLTDLINIKRIFKSLLSLTCAVVFITCSLVLNIKENSLMKVTVSANNSFYSIAIENDDKYTVIVNNLNKDFYPYKLKNIVRESKIENLILCDKNESDAKTYNLITRLNYFFDIENIYLSAGESVIKSIEKTFKFNGVYKIVDGGKIEFGDCFITTYEDVGSVIERNNIKILALSPVSKNIENYLRLRGDYDVVVFSEYAEGMNKLFGAEKIIDYQSNQHGYSIINDGNYVVKI